MKLKQEGNQKRLAARKTVKYNSSRTKALASGRSKTTHDGRSLKEYSQYTRSLIEASLDPLVTISASGKITDVNEASIRATGVPRTKLIGTDFSDYFTEPAKAREGYRWAFKKGFVADYPLTIKHKSGKLTHVLYNASVYKDDAGQVLGVFAAARDVTEQKWAIEQRAANVELVFQNQEKEKRAAELGIANKELAFQNLEKEKRAAELSIANKELIFQNEEKEKRAAELGIANKELAFQNGEKEKRAAELGLANKELVFQNEEKGKRAAELGIANKELAFQNGEKEKRAAELGIANKELAFQNEEKEKRAAELGLANKELVFQNEEKGKRAAELGIANKELAFQNEEKEKRAGELGIANKELAFQNQEKEKRAAELSIANKELVFQNEEKEKRASELILANKELEAFAYVSSHDMQEPLRKIRTFATRILETESQNLSEKGKDYFDRMQKSANRMQQLINDLLAFSRLNIAERKFENTDLNKIIEEVRSDLKENIEEKHATIESARLGRVNIIPFQFRQLLYNLISNALKFSKEGQPPHIVIRSRIETGRKLSCERLLPEAKYCHVSVSDDGIGFDPKYSARVFEVFQKLHSREEYAGTGIGLAIVKKIVENHKGIVTVTSKLNEGATFNIYFPVLDTVVLHEKQASV